MSKGFMESMWQSGHISGSNAAYVEALFEEYLVNPEGCSETWRAYFDQLPRTEAGAAGQDLSHATIRDHFLLLS